MKNNRSKIYHNRDVLTKILCNYCHRLHYHKSSRDVPNWINCSKVLYPSRHYPGCQVTDMSLKLVLLLCTLGLWVSIHCLIDPITEHHPHMNTWIFRRKVYGSETAHVWLALVELSYFDIIWIFNMLTHWGRVTHKCVSKLTIIGSDNGLSPGWRQAIIWTNAGILLIRPLGTNFNEMLIEIHTFSFKKMHLKLSSGKYRPSCLGLNVLTPDEYARLWIRP